MHISFIFTIYLDYTDVVEQKGTCGKSVYRICLLCPIWLVYLPIYLLASKNTAKHILQNNNFHLFVVHSCRDGRQLCFSAAYCCLSKDSINITIELSFDFWVKYKVNYLYLPIGISRLIKSTNYVKPQLSLAAKIFFNFQQIPMIYLQR